MPWFALKTIRRIAQRFADRSEKVSLQDKNKVQTCSQSLTESSEKLAPPSDKA